ncbi:MAG TPA: phosphoribosyltransferase [Bryobacteraceae bacterium]|jgi:predicted phosphoribosyltransferase
MRLPFDNRTDAGRRLGAVLAARKRPIVNPVVLALPRGGVPVGAEVAKALKCPLDVLVVRKLGVPSQPELAMGAIAGSTRVLDWSLIQALSISAEEIEEVAAREIREMERRQKLYRGDHPAADLSGRSIVLVDDGFATGSTMAAAARSVREASPRELIIAVPVGTAEACARLRVEAGRCVCLATPEPFDAVGCWYIDFKQVSDDEVRQLLKSSETPS